MIKTKKELKEYLVADRANNFLTKHSSTLSYLKILRNTEYHFNANHKIRYAFWRLKLHTISRRFLTYIPINVFGPGLSISHLGCIFVSNTAKCGENVRISQNTTIGATNGSDDSPVIGNNCFIGANACLIGNISIADDVSIAAGCVVVRSIFESGTTWGGVPAKKISDNDSHSNIPLFLKK